MSTVSSINTTGQTPDLATQNTMLGDEATFAATYTETAAVADDGSMLYASNVEVSATVADAVTGEEATVVVSQTEYAAVAPMDAADALFDDPFSTILLEDNAPTYDNTSAAMGAESGLVADSSVGAADTTDASLGSSVAALFDGTQATADGTGDAALGLYDDLFAAGDEQQLDGAADTQDADVAGPADADVAGLADADVAALAGVLDGMGLGQLGDLLTGADAQDASTGDNTGTVGDAYVDNTGNNTGTVGDITDTVGANTGTVGDAYHDNTGDSTGTVGDAYFDNTGDSTGTAGAAYDESYAADGAHGDDAYNGDGNDAAYYDSGYAEGGAYDGTDAYGDAAFDPSYDYDGGSLSLGVEMNALANDIMLENVV